MVSMRTLCTLAFVVFSLIACGPSAWARSGAGDAVSSAVRQAVSRVRSVDVKAAARAGARAVNPAEWVRTAKTNYAEHRFYATDMSTHPTMGAAFRRSLAPVDMAANVKTAFLQKFQPVRLGGVLLDPVQIEFSRQITSGKGIDVGKLAGALFNWKSQLTTFVGTVTGDVAGAAVQSLLCRMGPVGAAAGFLARPMVLYTSQILGYNVGQSWSKGMTFKSALASGIREIKPWRDIGLMVGGTLGSAIGQVCIPVPYIGGIIGGMVGGMLGSLVASGLSHFGPTARLEAALARSLGRLADFIEGKSGAAGSSGPTSPTTGASRSDEAASGLESTGRSPSTTLPTGSSGDGGEPDDPLSTADLRNVPR